MKRRNFLGLLTSAVAAVRSVAAWTPETFGYLDVDTARARGYDPASARVFLNDIDVTAERVMACDDRAGYLDVLARDGRGRPYADPQTRRLARARRYGRVRVVMRRRS